MSNRSSIKIIHAAMDEGEDGGIVIRGVLDPDSFHHLKVAEYQREILPQSKIKDLVKAYEGGGRVPDIELGMRGGSYREHAEENVYYLNDDVYIIDGLQRVTAGKVVMQGSSGKRPHLGVVVHTCTTEAWERERFRILNSLRTKLSPNVLLRNRKHDSQAIDCLYHLTLDKGFVMCGRVSWDQRKKREHLIDAMVFAKVVGALHCHLGPGLSVNVDQLTSGLEKTMATVGRTAFRDNLKTFFDAVDQAWGIREIVLTDIAPQIRLNFLRTLARVFSDHPVFWREARLFVDKDTIAKLKQFPIKDPGIAGMASGSSTSGLLLYQMIVSHINSGKRTRRLVQRADLRPLYGAVGTSEDEAPTAVA